MEKLMDSAYTIGQYLIKNLIEHNVRHVFGIPGDYVLGFYELMHRNESIEIINTCDEQGAGFAADAYARLNGLGAVCITYGVGGLKITNSTAQALVEKSPVIVISGGPSMAEREENALLHHKIGDFDSQLRIFRELTVASTLLHSGKGAREEIDRIFAAALKFKQPVYIELPRDMVHQQCSGDYRRRYVPQESNDQALQEALAETVSFINKSQHPVIVAGVEVHRFHLQEELKQIAETFNLPVAATILAKSVLEDANPQYMGIYEGATGLDTVREYVESSDCLVMLGAFMTDLNLGLFTANLRPDVMIQATADKIAIRHHHYDQVLFTDFVRGLVKAPITCRPQNATPRPQHPSPFVPSHAKNRLTIKNLFEQVNSYLSEEHLVIADVGDALFGANDLYISRSTRFLSSAYYASLGFAVPGAVGAQMALPHFRPLVLVGDGAFQMTGIELSTAARYGLNPIVIVLNNDGYSTERPMVDGAFNDVHPWNYAKIIELFPGGKGTRVQTEEELSSALLAAKEFTEGFYLIEVILDRHDRSPALLRLTEKLAQRVR